MSRLGCSLKLFLLSRTNYLDAELILTFYCSLEFCYVWKPFVALINHVSVLLCGWLVFAQKSKLNKSYVPVKSSEEMGEQN